MATSGTYTWATNTSTVINAALRKINRLGDFESVTSGDNRYDKALLALNPLIQRNAILHGMPMWAVNEATIAMSTTGLDTTTGTLIGVSQTINQVAPLRIIQAVRRDSSDATNPIDVPMEIYTYDYYTGTPNMGRIKLWLLPDSYWTTNGSLIIRYVRPFQDQVATTGEFDFPNYWIMALTYQLAYALAPDYGLDPTSRQQLKSDMEDEVEIALSGGTEEGAFRIQPRVKNW
jgi:hypothetical protein